MNRFVFVTLLLGLSSGFLTGCWDRVELNDRAMVMAWGMDVVKNQGYTASAQIAVPSKLGISAQGGGGKGDGFLVVTATGKSVTDAAQNMQAKLSRQVLLSHRRVLVVGELLARQGLGPILDEYSRNPDVRLRTDMFVVKGEEAQNLLRQSYPLENLPALAALKTHQQVGGMGNAALLDFLMAANTRGRTPTLPAIAFNPETSTPAPESENGTKLGFEMVGTALFDHHLRLLGYLDMEDARNLQWVRGTLQKLTLTATIPGTGGKVSLDCTKLTSSIRPTMQGQNIRIDVTLRAWGIVRENSTRLDLSQTAILARIQRDLAQAAANNVSQTIHKVQSQYRCDAFGFGEAVHRAYPYRWKSLQSDWAQRFPDVRVRVRATVKVQRVGFTGRPLQFAEGESLS
ncbi:MAG: Ger(x)C family spore germination protein [Alicyclobacillus herbarius]|uniref:Ger(x)C family spore germination protein n=1 Tax=Alicyclobacillus herbarius TaxID=122960 RepID=UPI00235601A0|nr:Ger(x)C family spore germination protein [Alicyclobacillus herbarius]MCL6631153.1 Ger(x)C family spore germination protein [Alicyclobacillus herbarius]